MATHYAADRRRKLLPGQSLEFPQLGAGKPFPLDDEEVFIPNESEVARVNSEYPEGVSRHGVRYLLAFHRTQKNPQGYHNSRIIEMAAESIRRIDFSDRPSRFHSWFACESVSDAKKFADSRNLWSPYNIVEMEAKQAFRANMNLLTVNRQDLINYWSGLPGGKGPLWEVLVQPPIKILRVVEEVEMPGNDL